MLAGGSATAVDKAVTSEVHKHEAYLTLWQEPEDHLMFFLRMLWFRSVVFSLW